MKERPLLFSGPMVRALLDGSKTQTRRIVKPQPDFETARNALGGDTSSTTVAYDGTMGGIGLKRGNAMGYVFPNIHCPYGKPGDRLWVRETWAQPTTLDPGPTVYRADYPACVPAGFENVPPAEAATWKPSIHMPRAMSRLTLEVTGVRVERLQSISDTDAAAEGVESLRNEGEFWKNYQTSTASCDYLTCLSAGESFRTLWDGINAARGFAWDANPFVWVIHFRRIQT
ncbi:hypothetical protein GCT13_08385 [Paraburkholderia sp. CNPSo 3157]|uniref:Morphogenetic protein n=1 Tax=Paraburkholderia franconis TaxID=2654983 RepID=A0A7X1TF37_9BURK|nr:hypothetical protein [Paraburkholderia franconis]MPW16948.1 hypothetical protein [Paraburkholderia franconis]